MAVLLAVLLHPWLYSVTATGAEPPQPLKGGASGVQGRSNGGLQPVLTVNPREIDLGSLGPGEEAKRVFYLRNVGSGSLGWTMEVPEGWTPIDQPKIAGVLYEKPEPLKVHLTFLNENAQGRLSRCSLLLRLEGEGQSAAFRREVPVGSFRDSLRFNSTGGTRTVFFHVRLSDLASASLLDVEPIRLDFGVVRPGEPVTQRVHVRNRGKETLKWKAGPTGTKGMPARAPTPEGRYVSFLIETAIGTGSYPATGQLREGLELSGPWVEERGYPVGQGELNALRYRFTGTGVTLFIWKTPEGGPLSIFFDEQFVNIVDGYAERREWEEVLITDGQPEGGHLLTVVNGPGRVALEGIRVLGKPLMKGNRGWISLFPNSGMTTRETDYINVALNTRQLVPGLYGDHVFFTSNGGEADVEVFLEVASETQPMLLTVYRYLAGSDYLYISNPQAETSRLQAKGYVGLGIAFRLFSSGTPGTTDFFRWFNPVKGDHFYSYDPQGGGKPLSGYHFEGSIGNIATSRLAGTRELYRWFQPSKGTHFYTVDPSGEGITKKGYRFDGIAGFVR
jgi:hypothetical protein